MKQCLLLILVLTSLCGCAQVPEEKQPDLVIGGGCEGCEAIFESPISFDNLNWIDTLPDYKEQGPQLEVTGTVYKKDGKTVAPGVVIYIYHTDQSGIYPTRGNEKGWGRRHGYIRGWIKTNEKGQYKFYTLRPASYPGNQAAAHIHVIVKEAGKTPYWIDEYLFSDDPLLPSGTPALPRGGNGVLKTTLNNGVLKAKRDLVLGLNIPGYPG